MVHWRVKVPQWRPPVWLLLSGGLPNYRVLASAVMLRGVPGAARIDLVRKTKISLEMPQGVRDLMKVILMHTNRHRSSKGYLFVVLSWLLARLWWGLEISRLAILRVKPRAVISRITQHRRELPAGQWVLSRDRLYCLFVNENEDRMIIRETPLIGRN